MNDDWHVILHIPRDLYSQWKEFNAKRGITSWGRYSGIVKRNSEIFTRAIQEEMEASSNEGK